MNAKALLVALLITASGLGLFWVYMQRFEAEASGGEPVPILMATRDLAPGAALTEDMIGIRRVPAAYVEERQIRASDLTAVIGVRLSMGVSANQSILWSDLATGSEQRRDLSTLVQPGMRAVTLSAGQGSTFGGLLRPGDRVDVLHTTTRAGREVTLPLLQNVLVLAVDSDTGGGENEERSPSRGRRISVSVTLDQAQLLAHADHGGDVTLVLRNPADIALVEDVPETSDEDILDAERRRAHQGVSPVAEAGPIGANNVRIR